MFLVTLICKNCCLRLCTCVLLIKRLRNKYIRSSTHYENKNKSFISVLWSIPIYYTHGDHNIRKSRHSYRVAFLLKWNRNRRSLKLTFTSTRTTPKNGMKLISQLSNPQNVTYTFFSRRQLTYNVTADIFRLLSGYLRKQNLQASNTNALTGGCHVVCGLQP